MTESARVMGKTPRTDAVWSDPNTEEMPARMHELCLELERELAEATSWTDEDKPLPEDAQIDAAHPLETNDYARYTEALRLVGAKRSKYALVDLVNWLLSRAAPVSPCVVGKCPTCNGAGELPPKPAWNHLGGNDPDHLLDPEPCPDCVSGVECEPNIAALARTFCEAFRKEFYCAKAVVEKWPGWVDGFNPQEPEDAAYLALSDALAGCVSMERIELDRIMGIVRTKDGWHRFGFGCDEIHFVRDGKSLCGRWSYPDDVFQPHLAEASTCEECRCVFAVQNKEG